MGLLVQPPKQPTGSSGSADMAHTVSMTTATTSGSIRTMGWLTTALTELIAPQGISQWYFGSGGTVGFHTISGLSAINHLVQEREAGRLDFMVWPHEGLTPDGKKHVLVESYPAICACPGDYGECRPTDQNQRDAWKVLQTLLKKRNEGTLQLLFQIKEQPFGRITGVDFEKQIQFEGFILGMN
jgi:hypothetical protein